MFPNTKFENKAFKNNFDFVIGIDEVGVGSLAGPVVACAVILNKETLKQISKIKGIKDSKMLSPKKREYLDKQIRSVTGIRYSISLSTPKIIDKINIYMATQKAMKKTVTTLRLYGSNVIVLVDGPRRIENINTEQLPIIKGDRKSITIACASIIAKVHRDNIMIKYGKKYPKYGFEIHKGYGTKKHLVSLTMHGVSSIHRKSFAPVSKLV